MLLEKWTFFDDVDVRRDATMGTLKERKAKLTDPIRRQAMKEIYDRSDGPTQRAKSPTSSAAKSIPTTCAPNTATAPCAISPGRKTSIPWTCCWISPAADDFKTEWLTPINNSKAEYCKEMFDHRTVAGFSDGGAHAKFQTLGVYPTEL